MINRFLLLYLLFFINSFVFSQQKMECGTSYIHEYLMATDPNYRAQIRNLETQVFEIIKNSNISKDTNEVYTIPVVFHVIHLGEPVGTGTNISDSQINTVLQELNNNFANHTGSGVDVKIQFCLAVRDPNDNPTTGINRVNGTVVPTYSITGIGFPSGICPGSNNNEDSIKSLSRWPVKDYLNIWIVYKICQGFLAGYAYYPVDVGNVNYGVVVEYDYLDHSLTHEVGHALFLYHTFEGDGSGSNCPVDTNCLLNGDRICDTPPHKRDDCTTNTCSTLGIMNNSLKNYMSYCSSRDRFTAGQRDRLRATMIVSPCGYLRSSPACRPVLNVDAAITEYLYPINTSYSSNCSGLMRIVVKFENQGINDLTSASFNYQIDGGSINVYNWTGDLNTGESVNVIMPEIYLATGQHDLLVYISNINSAIDEYNGNDTININFDYLSPENIVGVSEKSDALCFGDSTASVTVSPRVRIIEDWDNPVGWTLVNGSEVNKWQIGQIPGSVDNSIFISNDSVNNFYDMYQSSVVHFYKVFYLPPNSSDIRISFDYKLKGCADYDMLHVYCIPFTYIVNPGVNGPASFSIGKRYYNSYSTIPINSHEEIDHLEYLSGQKVCLIFTWANLGFYSSGNTVQPPAMVDNIEISYNSFENGPYSYTWNTIPAQSTNTAVNLHAGSYTVTVTDNNGCVADTTILIIQPDSISIIEDHTDTICIGSIDGSINTSVFGGTLQKYYFIEDWENGNVNGWTFLNSNQINKWTIGNSISYEGSKSVYVSKDSLNYEVIGQTSISHFYKEFQFPLLATNISISFTWKSNHLFDRIKFFITNVNDPPPLPGNGYIISAEDFHNQNSYYETTFSGLNMLAGKTMRIGFTWMSYNDHITSSGSIDNIVVSYDIDNSYTYLWNTTPVSTSPILTGLQAGNYTVIVADGNGCTNTSTVIINEYPSYNNEAINTSNDTMFSPYNQPNCWYLVGDNTPLGSSIYYVCNTSGYYYVVGTDDNGCNAISDSISMTCLTQNPPLNSLSAFSVFPSPANSNINIIADNIENGTYIFKIFNASGVLLDKYETEVCDNFYIGYYPVSAINSGLYFLSIEKDNVRYVISFIKDN